MYHNPYPQTISDDEKSAGFHLKTIDALYTAAVCPIDESNRIIKRSANGKACYMVERYGLHPHDAGPAAWARWITLHETQSFDLQSCLATARVMIGKDYQQQVVIKISTVMVIPPPPKRYSGRR